MRKTILLSLSAFAYMIYSYLSKKINYNDKTDYSNYRKIIYYYDPKNIIHISPDDISLFKYLNQPVVITGKIKRDDSFLFHLTEEENHFRISGKSTRGIYIRYKDSDVINSREYSLESGVRPIFITQLFLKEFGFKSYLKAFKNYFIYDDVVSVLGVLKLNIDTGNYFLDASMISLGNKASLDYYYKILNKLSDYAKITFLSWTFFTLLRIVFNPLLIKCGFYINPKNQIKKFLKKVRYYNEPGYCLRCKYFCKNVYSEECNHFTYCLRCYEDSNKKCPLCYIDMKNSFRIITDC